MVSKTANPVFRRAPSRLRLAAGGGDGSTAVFDHVRVWSLDR